MNRIDRIKRLEEILKQAAGTPEYEQWEKEQTELGDEAFRDLLKEIGRSLMPWIAVVDSNKAKCAMRLQNIIMDELKKLDK